MKKFYLGCTLLSAAIASLSESTIADSTATCSQQYYAPLGRDTLVWTLRWDTFDDLIYDVGVASVVGTGPVPITPFSGGFDPTAALSNEFEVILVENYGPPGIWTLNGSGGIYRIISDPTSPVGVNLEFNPPGIVSKSCSGGF